MKTEVMTKWGPWNGHQLKLLKDGYEAAKAANRDQFTIGDQPVLTSFAGYLIEFLEGEGLVALEEASNDG